MKVLLSNPAPSLSRGIDAHSLKWMALRSVGTGTVGSLKMNIWLMVLFRSAMISVRRADLFVDILWSFRVSSDRNVEALVHALMLSRCVWNMEGRNDVDIIDGKFTN